MLCVYNYTPDLCLCYTFIIGGNMDSEIKPNEESKPVDDTKKITPSKNKNSLSKALMLGLFVLIIVGVSASISYWWRNETAREFEKKLDSNIASLKKTNKDLSGKLAAEKAKNSVSSVDVQTVCTPVSPSISVIDSIKASITSGNTAALEGYMATSVQVILAGTKSYGAQDTNLAVFDITNFISGATSPWDFLLPVSVLNLYTQGSYKQYFPDIDVIGRSVDKKVISFSFDCNAKINAVLLAPDEDLLK